MKVVVKSIKEEVEKEFEKEVGVIGHQLQRHELCDHYKTDVENELTKGEARARSVVDGVEKLNCLPARSVVDRGGQNYYYQYLVVFLM